MSDRDRMLARIREALSQEARAPHGRGLPTVAEHRQALPPVTGDPEEQLALFARNAAGLQATFKMINDERALGVELQALAQAGNWQRVATHEGALARTGASLLGLPTLVTSPGYDKFELEKCDAAITECDALIAQTGTVLVTSQSAGGRALTCLPPHHVVIARREQLVPDLPAAFVQVKQKYGASLPSMIAFISGPSRTGDIERILVLGAHGPKQLTILCF